MKEKYKKGELAKEILKYVALGGMVIVCVSMPGMAIVLNMFSPKDQKERNKIRRAFKNLEKQHLVSMHTKNGKDVIKITEKGKKRFLRYEFEDLMVKKPNKWNGKWHIVVFDIPSRFEKTRKIFRFKLDQFGFKNYQKSVFITPYECKDEINFISEYLHLSKYVKYITVDRIDDHEKVKKMFKLK